MAYAQQGSALTLAGLRHVPISVDASSPCLQESDITDRRMAIVISLATFWLCRGFWRKVSFLSINQMEAGEIQRELGGPSDWGGGGLQGLEFWELIVRLATFLGEGGPERE